MELDEARQRHAELSEQLHTLPDTGGKLTILVGDEPYYAKLGFKRTPQGRVVLPGPVDPELLLHCELQPGAFEGVTGNVDGTPFAASLHIDSSPSRKLQLSISGDSFDLSSVETGPSGPDALTFGLGVIVCVEFVALAGRAEDPISAVFAVRGGEQGEGGDGRANLVRRDISGPDPGDNFIATRFGRRRSPRRYPADHQRRDGSRCVPRCSPAVPCRTVVAGSLQAFPQRRRV